MLSDDGDIGAAFAIAEAARLRARCSPRNADSDENLSRGFEDAEDGRRRQLNRRARPQVRADFGIGQFNGS